ncbi:MAG: ECF-type sigma factor [Acidobacteriota bacterium]
MTTENGSPGDLTVMLARWQAGDESALEEMLPEIYGELRVLANHYLRRGPSRTLQPTELINEAFLRLIGAGADTKDRNHFFAFAARTMRHVLVDRFRRRDAAKRGGSPTPVTLVTSFADQPEFSVDLLDLNRALERLGEVSPRAVQIVELRFFGGLTNEDVADVLDISLATIARDWRAARVWLANALKPPSAAT